VDAERQWLELMGHVLAAPLTVLPEEHIATALKATFDAPACCFHTRVDPLTIVQRIYPPTMFSAAVQAEWVRLTIEAPTRHPLLRYYLVTGDLTPQQVADVPSGMAGPRARAQWAELSRCHGIEHQLAIPLPPGTEGLRWFVLGRPDAFGADGMHLARRVQKLIAGLDRQAAALRQWQRRAPHPEAAAVATAVATDIRLTPRELSVLVLVADGLTAAAVAHLLSLAERTVYKHLERAYAKLGVSDRVSAVLRAQRLGILSEPALAMAR
jgi:DNA-binding CsgD family transcriptional regulator